MAVGETVGQVLRGRNTEDSSESRRTGKNCELRSELTIRAPLPCLYTWHKSWCRRDRESLGFPDDGQRFRRRRA